MAHYLLPATGLALATILAGCGKPQVQTYRVETAPPPAEQPVADSAAAPDAALALPQVTTPRPTPAPAAQSPGMPGTGGLTNSPPVNQLDWNVPTAWQAQPERPMRRATYIMRHGAAQAELAITSFPGDVGGLAANINRWRTQLSLPTLPEGEVAATAEKVNVAGREAYLVNFAGVGSGQMAPMGGGAPAPAAAEGINRTLGLILPFEQETWFFKVGGPDAAVAALEPQFRQFMETIHLHGGPDDHHHAQEPAAAAPTTSTPPAAAIAGPQLDISVPATWVVSQEKKAFRVATITVPAPSGKPEEAAELGVTALTGPYGTLEENAERWWQELQRPIAEAPGALKVIAVPAEGSPFTIRVIDLNPPAPHGQPTAQGMLVGVVEQGQYSWFCKLKGHVDAVEANRETFTVFLQKLGLQ